MGEWFLLNCPFKKNYSYSAYCKFCLKLVGTDGSGLSQLRERQKSNTHSSQVSLKTVTNKHLLYLMVSCNLKVQKAVYYCLKMVSRNFASFTGTSQELLFFQLCWQFTKIESSEGFPDLGIVKRFINSQNKNKVFHTVLNRLLC